MPKTVTLAGPVVQTEVAAVGRDVCHHPPDSDKQAETRQTSAPDALAWHAEWVQLISGCDAKDGTSDYQGFTTCISIYLAAQR